MAWTTPGTATAGEVLTAAFWNANVRDNLNELAPLFAAATSWTPTMSNTWANGNATATGKYYKVGRLVNFWAQITIGSTTTKGASALFLSLPVPAATYNSDFILMTTNIRFLFQDAGTNVYTGMGGDPVSHTASTVVATVANTAGTYASVGFITSTIPFTWTTGDNIIYNGTYEAAS